MPVRPDLREIASNVRDAFADLDKDALLDVLTFVVKEYVVEGPPPMLVHQAETLADLRSASFAQLISAMQTRFDFPELAMFVVDGEQVSVRINGVVQPLIGQRQPLAAPTVQMVDTRPQPGVRVVETNLAATAGSTTSARGKRPTADAWRLDARPTDQRRCARRCADATRTAGAADGAGERSPDAARAARAE